MIQSNTQKEVRIMRQRASGWYNKTAGFSKAFGKLDEKEKEAFITEAMEQTNWSLTTFYNRCNGRYPCRYLEISVIEAIFEGFELDAWTGKRI